MRILASRNGSGTMNSPRGRSRESVFIVVPSRQARASMMPFAARPRRQQVEDLEIASYRREPSDQAESTGRNVGAAWSRRDDSALQESDRGETLTTPTSASPAPSRASEDRY